MGTSIPTGVLTPSPVGGRERVAGTTELLGAGLLRESLPVRLAWEWSQRREFPAQEGYDPLEDPLLKDLPGNDITRFSYSRSPAETAWIMERANEDRRREHMLERSGWRGMAATLLGAVANPSAIAPIPLYRGSEIMGGLKAGAAMAGMSAVEQTILGDYDASRDGADFVMNVAMSGAVGFAVGGIASRYYAQTERFRTLMDDFEAGRAVQPVGAAVAPGANPGMASSTLDDLTPKGAFFLERLGMNPTLGLLKSGLTESRELVEQLVEIPFFLRQDAKGIARQTSIEAATRPYRAELVDAMREGTNNWLAMRTGSPGGIKEQLKLQATDAIRMTKGMGLDDFMVEVGKAMRRGDAHPVAEVARTAGQFRKVIDRIAKQAAEVGAFEEIQVVRREVVNLREQLGDFADLPRPVGPKAQPWPPATEKLRDKLDDAMTRLRAVEGKVPPQMTALSYLPRVWRHDVVVARQAELEGILADWFRRTGAAKGAEDRAKQAVQNILNDKPFQRLDDPNVTGQAMSLHNRKLDIPDELVEEFLESDAAAVLRHHVRTMSGDIEIVRHQNARHDYGLLSMWHDRKAVKDAWMDRIKAFSQNGEMDAVREANAQMTADLERITGLRDRIRGTAGLTQDPWSLSSRSIRVAKQVASTLYMGGAALTASLDIMRPIIAEGLTRTLRHGYAPLFRDARPLVMQMAKREAELAGTALDLTNGLYSAVMLDTGDIFGKYGKLERFTSKMADLTFVANGLSFVDQNIRTVASMITGTRILENAGKWGAGGLPVKEVEKMARAGIDQPMAERIARMDKIFGDTVDGVRIANSARWTDADAASAFRRALGEDIDRIVPLRGAGDTPLFMSTPLGSLLMLYRSFGFAGLMRTTIPALQQSDKEAFVGMAMLVAGAGLMNVLRDGINGYEKERGFSEQIQRAVDRSGLAGIVGDVVGAANRIADRGLPGAIDALGPAASMGTDVGKVLIDMANRGAMSPEGAHAARRLLPWNTMVWADGVFDGIEKGLGGR